VDFTQPPASAANLAASLMAVPLFICPSDVGYGRVPGSLHGGTNYVANVGTGTIGFGLIASGDGVFTQTPLGFRDLLDGSSNTAAFSETLLGNGVNSVGPTPGNPAREVLEVPGGSDPTPGACASAAGVWSGQRSAKWIDGHYGNALYNHYYTPNTTQWDCGNGSHNKGLSTARSVHPAGVNVLLCDGSVRSVSNSVDINTWRALGTRNGGEVVLADF
jgi:prepilin-type processing-associated H-X9-DG protein